MTISRVREDCTERFASWRDWPFFCATKCCSVASMASRRCGSASGVVTVATRTVSASSPGGVPCDIVRR